MMNEQQIQLGLHLAFLADDRYTLLFRKKGHPHALLGAGFLLALLKGREYATNAEIVENLKLVYQAIDDAGFNLRSDAPGCTGNDFIPLPEDKFVSATIQTLDLLHALKFVPATGNYLVMQDFYNYY